MASATHVITQAEAEAHPPLESMVVRFAGDSGDDAGARALHHAARELLAECFADMAADGPPVQVTIDAGPPLVVRISEGARHDASAGGAWERG